MEKLYLWVIFSINGILISTVAVEIFSCFARNSKNANVANADLSASALVWIHRLHRQRFKITMNLQYTKSWMNWEFELIITLL